MDWEVVEQKLECLATKLTSQKRIPLNPQSVFINVLRQQLNVASRHFLGCKGFFPVSNASSNFTQNGVRCIGLQAKLAGLRERVDQ